MTLNKAMEILQGLVGEGVTCSIKVEATKYRSEKGLEYECRAYVSEVPVGGCAFTKDYQNFEPMLAEIAAVLGKPSPCFAPAPEVELCSDSPENEVCVR